MTFNVKSYGAAGNGVTDDRAAFQAAIDAAAAVRDEVLIPHGTYILSQAGSNAYCLNIPSGVQLRGVGRGASILKQAPAIAVSVRLLHVQGDDVVIRDLCIDGNKANQTVTTPPSGVTQRAGVFAEQSARLSIINVVAQNFTGDGFTLHGGIADPLVLNCKAQNNGRNGITFNPDVSPCDGIRLVSSEFVGNTSQQIDSEPTTLGVPITNVSIVGCLVDAAGGNDYVITTAGPDATHRNKDWSITGCTINGSVEVLWIEGLSIVGCHGVNPTTKPSIDIQHRVLGASITGNSLFITQTTVDSVPVVSIAGTGTSEAPESIIVANNRLDAKGRAGAFGVVASGCISVTVVDNVIDGPGLSKPAWSGVDLRATNAGEDFRSCIVRGNTIRNWGDIGVRVTGNGTARMLAIDVSHNVFDDTAGTMTNGISFDDTSPPLHAVQSAVAVGNQYIGGVTTQVKSWPACAVGIAGQRGHL